MIKKYDVIIIGGSYAGMSAAMALGRSRKNTLIIDGGDPCNKSTPHSNNFLTQDGVAPSEIAKISKNQLLKYPSIQWYNSNVYDVMGEEGAFEVAIDGGKTVLGRRVILAGGLVDVLPDIPGFKDCWGKNIVHCPYCHGYEFSDQKTGILVSATQALEMVKLISNWTSDLKLFLTGDEVLNNDEFDIFIDKAIQVVTQPIREVVNSEGVLSHLILEDGTNEPLKALYARLPIKQKISFVKMIGCNMLDSGHIEVDMFGKTTVDGVYAVGDCASPMRSVATAVYTGNIAGAIINKELIEEDF